MNLTNEPVNFRWIIPKEWKNRIYWIYNGKKVSELQVPPNTNLRKVELDAYIDPSIKNSKTVIPSVVIAQSQSRVEWFALPILSNREDDLFLTDEEINPKL